MRELRKNVFKLNYWYIWKLLKVLLYFQIYEYKEEVTVT